MKAFAAPVDDILFSLQRVAGASRLPGWDEELVCEIIGQYARFMESEVAPLNVPGDVAGCRLEDGRVRMPPGFRAAYRAYVEQGWPGLAFPERFGGQGLHDSLSGALTEIYAAANHSLEMLCGLVSGAARALRAFGSEEQQLRCLPRLASGEWLATMCLSEPGAGSDLARIRTSAVQDDPVWRITGEKIFISGGDHDLADGILHLVLARTGAIEDGIGGLSLFLCPSQDDRGVRNAIRVARIEDKMGLHAAPTCHLSFEGARAELIGRPGEGLKGMFVMMNRARIGVALQGVAHAARAAAMAGAYAADRVQGKSAGTGSAVTIDRHGDVRRMLMEQQSLAAASRSLCHLSLVMLDEGGRGDLLDFLTPVCKFLGSEAGIRAADLGIQVLGGYGYLREYGMEQVYRDARVTALYEGTNGIQAMTVAGRLLRSRDGAAADAFEQWVADVVLHSPEPGASALGECLRVWSEARLTVRAADDPGPYANDFMQLSCVVASLAVWQLVLAQCDSSTAAPDHLAGLAERQIRFLPEQARHWSALLRLRQ